MGGQRKAWITHQFQNKVVDCCGTEQLHAVSDFTFQDLDYLHNPGVSVSLERERRRSAHA
jgi:hypothetical protein